MSSVPYEMWISYLKLLWANFDMKPSRILEVCCGTGTLSRMLAKEGFHVVGVDLSSAMIKEAKRIAKQENTVIRYEKCDACAMSLNETFDAAFSFFDSLNYLANADQCKQAIVKTANHLRHGGCFVFDVNTAYAFEQNMFDQRDKRKDAAVAYDWKSDYDRATKICRVTMHFWADGKAFIEEHFQRAHSLQELEEWMKAAGFRTIHFYDAYTLDPPRPRSDRVHAVGIR
jgi:ubiquinone/menaquinone biosynthesis C-methylase UbiE